VPPAKYESKGEALEISVAPPMPSPQSARMPANKDPLHGITLEKILEALVAHHGWHGLAARIEIRCFMFDPSITSSLKFLRRTPWARAKVEQLYRELVQ
jgi:uncharacterized protein (DUF2132 family)